MHKDEFIQACRFAKVVYTPLGAGILIGGLVFTLQEPPSAPPPFDSDFTGWLVSALRNPSPEPMAGQISNSQSPLLGK